LFSKRGKDEFLNQKKTVILKRRVEHGEKKEDSGRFKGRSDCYREKKLIVPREKGWNAKQEKKKRCEP